MPQSLSDPHVILNALFSLPLFSFVIAAIMALGILVIRRPSRAVVPPTYLRELKMLGVVAVTVVVIFAIENIVRGYLLCLVGMCLVDVVDWWRYPLPLITAALGLGIVLVAIMTRGTRAPEEPMLPTSRRTWATFGPRGGLVVAGVTLMGFVAITVASGLASSSDENGRFIYLELVAPNTTLQPVRPWFYGWSYGVPVLVSVTLLALVILALLSRNAARPYRRADTITAEQGARAIVAASAVHVATGAALLGLAGALRFIARAGDLSSITVGDSEPYEIVWRYAALASAAGWVAPLLEVAGFAILLLVAVRSARTVARVELVAEATSR